VLEHVTLHDIRRTAARFMVEAGVPIAKVAQLLGHTNESITYSVYGGFAPDALKDAAEILNLSEVREGRSQVQ
jgi:integrase